MQPASDQASKPGTSWQVESRRSSLATATTTTTTTTLENRSVARLLVSKTVSRRVTVISLRAA